MLKLQCGSEGSAVREASKSSVNLSSSRCTSRLKGAAEAPLGLPQNVIYCSSVSRSGDIFYPTLVDKTYPGDYTSGAIGSAATPAPVTVDTRQLDPGVSSSFVSTDLCFFYPPLNLKPLSFSKLPLPPLPPSPTHSSHTHTNKEMGPLQFILLAL